MSISIHQTEISRNALEDNRDSPQAQAQWVLTPWGMWHHTWTSYTSAVVYLRLYTSSWLCLSEICTEGTHGWKIANHSMFLWCNPKCGYRWHIIFGLYLIVTSSNGNIVLVTCPLWGKSTSHWFHRSLVDYPYKCQWHGDLMFSLISAWIIDWAHIRCAGDLRRYRAHNGVTVMNSGLVEKAPSWCHCRQYHKIPFIFYNENTCKLIVYLLNIILWDQTNQNSAWIHIMLNHCRHHSGPHFPRHPFATKPCESILYTIN